MLLEGRGGQIDNAIALILLEVYIENVQRGKEPFNELKILRKKAALPPYAKSSSLNEAADQANFNYWRSNKTPTSYIDAHYRLGKMYHNGIGVKSNPFEAKRYYKVVSTLGHIESQYALGQLCEQGLLGLKNINKSKYYYDKAAEAGHEFAKMRISMGYVARKTVGGFFSTPAIPTDEELNERKDNCLIM